MSKKDSDLILQFKVIFIRTVANGIWKTKQNKTPDTTEGNGGENCTRDLKKKKKVTVAQHYT